MKFNHIQSIVGGAVVSAALIGMPSCSDDHFDITNGGYASAGQTIWQNIKANPELSNFGEILEQLKVYTKEEDRDSMHALTYAQLLNQNQSLTVWAPINGSFDAEQYKTQLSHIAQLRADAKASNPKAESEEANLLEYNLGIQFAQNYIARFNFEAAKGEQNVYLLNGKSVYYNAGAKTFNDIAVNSDIPSSNGVLHLLNGENTFLPNIYEYMGTHSDIFGNVYGTLTDPKINKKTFDENSSTPGGLNKDGKMVYVDSVWTTNNSLLNSCGAQVKNEDSLYVAVIPTDAAWNIAYEKVKSLFKYDTQYKWNYTQNSNIKYAFTETKRYTQHEVDSLSDYEARKVLLTNMYFTPSIFPENVNNKSLSRSERIESIKKYAEHADSLITTAGKVFYNPNGKKLNPSSTDTKNPLFGDATASEASNGIIYPVSSYDVDPSYTIMQRQEIDLLYSDNVAAVYSGQSVGKGEYFYLTEGDNYDAYHPDSVGTIDYSPLGVTKGYRYFTADNKSDLQIFIPLKNLLSGKYRILAQILPNRIDKNHRIIIKSDDDLTELDQEIQFAAQLKSDNDEEWAATGEAVKKRIHVDDSAIKTYEIFNSVEIKRCYYNLTSDVKNSYPLLKLYINSKWVKDKDKGAHPALSISRIIVEPVHETSSN